MPKFVYKAVDYDLLVHAMCGSSYLFTTYVTSCLAMVLLELGWGFNGTFTD